MLRSYRGSKANVWLFVCLIIPLFHLPSNFFTSTLHIRLGFPHPLALKVTHCFYGQPLNVVMTHLFFVPMVGNGLFPMMWFKMHLFSIVKAARFHVSHEQTHVLPPPFSLVFLSMGWHHLRIDGIRTLADVVITNPTQIDLVSQVVSSCGVV
jgi:hypothetical protein